MSISTTKTKNKKAPKKASEYMYGEYVCILCHHRVIGLPNDAEPVHDGICCDECYQKVVVPAILRRKYW